MKKVGGITRTLFLKGIESHKLHQEFTVADGTKVMKGMPVVLTDTGDVKPANVATNSMNIIGYSIHNGDEKELVTIGMKAFAIVFASPKAVLKPGPVKFDGNNPNSEGYMSYSKTDSNVNHVGWAIDEATAPNDVIRVAIF